MTSIVSLTCRAARRDDIPALLAMIGELAAFHGDTPTIDAATLERDAFGADRWVEALVGEHDGQLVAYAVLCSIYRAQLGQRGIDLHHLFVAAPWRGKGVGRQMMDAVAQRARTRGCAYMVVGTAADNVAAHRFYDSLGLERAIGGGPRFRLDLKNGNAP